MLEELSIRDFAIVDRLTVQFGDRLNVLSGETGAGKSILIGALGFLLGVKVDTGIIRAGADESLVTAIVSVDKNKPALDWLANHNIDAEDGAVVIRRSLKKTGRSTAYIQNVPVVRQDLADFASHLIEIHGQRDGHSLLRKDRHRELLDKYAGIENDVEKYTELYASLSAKRKLLESMTVSEAERSREIELLRFAIEEIDEAALKLNEEEDLVDEERRLSQHEKLYAAVSQCSELLSDADGVIIKLRKAKSQLEISSAIDPRLLTESRRLDDAYYELEDISKVVASYLNNIVFDAGRLEQIEARMSVLQKLKRKYGNTEIGIPAVLEYRKEAEKKLNSLEHLEEDRAGLEAEISVIEAQVFDKAKVLTETRREAAKKLEAAIVSTIATLGMANARFIVRLASLTSTAGKVVVGPYGQDDVEFYLSANKGEPPRPLIDIASGGELSRFMLALKTVLSEDGGTPALVFDEIDTGIGGEVALAVGKHLAKLSETKQVLCITHLASIAARAYTHYMVEKNVEADRTVTKLFKLDKTARVKEVARMLSGDAASQTSLDHATELIQKLGPVLRGF